MSSKVTFVATPAAISDLEWIDFQRNGLVVLNQRVPDDLLSAMRDRVNEMMLHGRNTDHLMMQRESPSGVYQNAGEQTLGWKGSSPDYRKITGLEQEPVFNRFFDSPHITEARDRAYGSEADSSRFRAMIMNKSASGGTELPYHQDRWDFSDCEPRLSIYVALDPAPIESGCVEAFVGSHTRGLLSEHHRGVISDDQLAQIRADFEGVLLTLDAGQVVLLNCMTVHGSGLNRSGKSRRALSYLM